MANRNFNSENRLLRGIVEFNRALPQDRALLEATENFRRMLIYEKTGEGDYWRAAPVGDLIKAMLRHAVEGRHLRFEPRTQPTPLHEAKAAKPARKRRTSKAS